MEDSPIANPYSSVSISNFNVSPPSDDASEVDSNQVEWDKHLTKLATPLKNLAESINTNVANAFGKRLGTTFETKSTNYNIAAPGDQGKFFVGTGTITFTLPAVADAGDGFPVAVRNGGAGTVTVDGNASELIDSDTSIVLNPGESIFLTCDGSTWIGVVVPVFGSTFESKSTNYTIVAGDKNKFFDVTGTTTITLLPVATAGDGFVLVIINNGSGLVTIDGTASELINGTTTIELDAGAGIILTCDGATWLGLISVSGIVGEITKVKTADKPLASNTTLEDDNHLFGWTLVAGKHYSIEGYLLYVENSGDLKMAFQLSDAPQLSEWTVDFTNTSAIVQAAHITDIETAIGFIGLNLINASLKINGVFQANASIGGTLDFQWAQNSSSANDTIVKQGSWIKITRLD